MTAALIAQLIVALGPTALDLIPKLTALWQAPSLTLDQVIALCAPAKESYDAYITAAKAAQSPPIAVLPPPAPPAGSALPSTTPEAGSAPAAPPV